MDLVREEIAKLIEEAKVAYADKTVSVSEAMGLLTKASMSFIAIYAQFKTVLDASDMKTVITESVVQFYESVIRPMDIPGVPGFIENTVVDPMISKMIPYIVPALYDALMQYLPGVHDDTTPADPRVILGLPPATA
jgi:hypothetical protein